MNPRKSKLMVVQGLKNEISIGKGIDSPVNIKRKLMKKQRRGSTRNALKGHGSFKMSPKKVRRSISPNKRLLSSRKNVKVKSRRSMSKKNDLLSTKEGTRLSSFKNTNTRKSSFGINSRKDSFESETNSLKTSPLMNNTTHGFGKTNNSSKKSRFHKKSVNIE
jgi:hypothetical protein